MKHKYWVWYYMNKCGHGWRGLWHDMSKFSPTEFWESVKYYSGTRSPIDACKEDKGISMAWMHHKGRNPHHYEYYVDNMENGGEARKMPYKYAIELICDYLGAGRAYMGKNFSIKRNINGGVIKENGQHLKIGYVYLNETYGNIIVYIEQLPE